MSSTAFKPGIVSFEEARHIVEEHAAKVLALRSAVNPTQVLDLLAAHGRVLAEEILADRDFPPFARATRDGYAVCAADVESVPARLQVIGEIKAGDSPEAPGRPIRLCRGQAVSIMTGAPLPPGADAVVMVEYTKADGPSVAIHRGVKSGENFVPRGAEARAGQVLAERGRRIDHAMIALAASVGKPRVEVLARPRVAILATGDELVELAVAPAATQIRNSNSYSLAAQIEDAGGEPVRLAIAPDEPVRLRALIEEGLKCDLLLITGGVSMGKYDLVEQVLGDLNAEFYFTGAQIQPGKPIVFGARNGPPVGKTAANAPSSPKGPVSPPYFFGLPGNPVSTMVTFRLFVRPMISALSGTRPEPLVFLKARLKAEVRTKTGLTRFVPAVISGEFENAEVELVAWHGSGDVASLAQANCYLVIPPDRERIAAGDWIPVLVG